METKLQVGEAKPQNLVVLEEGVLVFDASALLIRGYYIYRRA